MEVCKQEFAARLAKTKDEKTSLTSELEELKTRKVAWLTAGKPARDMKPLNEELRIDQERLLDLAVTEAALEAKLRIYEQNEPAATEKRKEVIAADERCREHVEALIKLQQETRPHIEAVLKENSTIGRLDEEHLTLVGDRMNIPHITIPYQASNFAGAQVPPIEPLRPWQYASEEERAASLQEEHLRMMKVQEERARVAQNHAPDCPDCGKPMNLHVDRSWKEKLGESPITRGHWSFQHCNTRLDHVVPETK